MVAAVCAHLARRRRKVTPCRAVFVSWLTVTLRRDSSSATLSAESSFSVCQSNTCPSGPSSNSRARSTANGSCPHSSGNVACSGSYCWINVSNPSSAATLVHAPCCGSQDTSSNHLRRNPWRAHLRASGEYGLLFQEHRVWCIVKIEGVPALSNDAVVHAPPDEAD